MLVTTHGKEKVNFLTKKIVKFLPSCNLVTAHFATRYRKTCCKLQKQSTLYSYNFKITDAPSKITNSLKVFKPSIALLISTNSLHCQSIQTQYLSLAFNHLHNAYLAASLPRGCLFVAQSHFGGSESFWWLRVILVVQSHFGGSESFW